MMLYHNEPPNGNGKSQPNRNIVDDNTEIRDDHIRIKIKIIFLEIYKGNKYKKLGIWRQKS